MAVAVPTPVTAVHGRLDDSWHGIHLLPVWLKFLASVWTPGQSRDPGLARVTTRSAMAARSRSWVTTNTVRVVVAVRPAGIPEEPGLAAHPQALDGEVLVRDGGLLTNDTNPSSGRDSGPSRRGSGLCRRRTSGRGPGGPGAPSRGHRPT